MEHVTTTGNRVYLAGSIRRRATRPAVAAVTAERQRHSPRRGRASRTGAVHHEGEPGVIEYQASGLATRAG